MGSVLLLVSAACFGAMAVFGKLAYAAGVDTPTLLLVRFALAAICLLGLAALTSRPGGRWARPGPRPPLRVVVVVFVAMGCVGYAAQAGFYFSALRVMDASLVAIVLYTYPALVTLAAVALGRERLTVRRLVALLLASAGVVLVVGGSSGGTAVGVALAFGGALTYTGYILIADRVGGYLAPVTLSAIVMSGASATVLAWSVAGPGLRLDVSPAAWLWLILIALVSTVLAMVTFLAGLRLTGPSKAAILSTFEPVVTALLAALVLAETLRPSQVLGGAVVLTSVVVLQGYPRVRSADAWSVRRRAPAERTAPGTPTAPAAELDA